VHALEPAPHFQFEMPVLNSRHPIGVRQIAHTLHARANAVITHISHPLQYINIKLFWQKYWLYVRVVCRRTLSNHRYLLDKYCVDTRRTNSKDDLEAAAVLSEGNGESHLSAACQHLSVRQKCSQMVLSSGCQYCDDCNLSKSFDHFNREYQHTK
jgi:hypothetical protein